MTVDPSDPRYPGEGQFFRSALNPEQETPPMDRPNPLQDAASKAGAAWAALHGVIGAAVAFGVLTAAQGDAVNAAGDAISPTLLAIGTVLGGVIPIVSTLIGAFRTAASARDNVTPLADPRNAAGEKLTPEGR